MLQSKPRRETKLRRMALTARTLIVFNTLLVIGFNLAVGFAQDEPQSEQIQMILTVTDSHRRYVGGLRKDTLIATDNKVALEVVSLEELSFPASIGLIFNVSKALHSELLRPVRQQLLTLAAQTSGVNEYFIMSFNDGDFLASDWTRNAGELSNGFVKLSKSKSEKNASTYDALLAGLKKIDTATHFKRALILVTDLRDGGPKAKREELEESLRRSNTLLYAIDTEMVAVAPPNTFRKPDLKPLCSLSGGFADTAKTLYDLEGFLEVISLELAHQYLVVFKPKSDAPKGEWRRLRFVLKPINLKEKGEIPLFARGREGYYP